MVVSFLLNMEDPLSWGSWVGSGGETRTRRAGLAGYAESGA